MPSSVARVRVLFAMTCRVWKKVKATVASVFIAAAVSFGSPAVGRAADLAQPAVDREASEEAFLEAYGYFQKNMLWNALDKLQESLGHNVYFVDAYFMRSLALRRLGRYTDAIDAMSQYLEVRRSDHRGLIILDTMKSEWGIVQRAVRPENAAPALSFSRHTINEYLGLPLYGGLSIKGMSGIGKINATESHVMICDTLGDKVWIFARGGKRGAIEVAAPRPAALMQVAPYEALLFQENGEVGRITIDPSSENAVLANEGTIDADIADAAFIDSAFFALADRKGGAVRLCDLPSLRQTAEWKPEGGDSGKLFEPVAVASWGALLAVADRGNGRVFVLDSYTLAVLDEFEAELPRDLEWGGLGELYVLTESGALYSRYPVGSASADVRMVTDGMKEAWSLSRATDGPIVASVSGRTWWSGRSNPGYAEAFGAVTLHDPWIEAADDSEVLMMRCAVASTFQSFIQDKAPMTHVVWRDETRPSRITEVRASHEGTPRFYSPVSGQTPEGIPVIQASSITDVMQDIAKSSRSGEPIPRVIVLDTRISGTDGQLALFLGFLLRQGVRLDIWPVQRPAPPMLCRISGITLGNAYYTRAVRNVPLNDLTEWILSVPLPPDVSTFGYPSDATLTLFSDIDAIQFSDWIPIWPSLIKRR
ncbi:MAG: hypothetical protein LBQ36_04165 [Synergistaceae bacterium]|jgi:hypothetical protein|nr:hypothetical protein [Synergistaceae bacterium]